MRLSEELISRICGENDIIDYISQYVALKKTGRGYMGLCPFHGEKTPSFSVNREKQLFHCFGCGASGNLVQFVMRAENLDFIEAMKLLADRAGIIIPEDDDFDDANHQIKERILKMNRLAGRFFYDKLMEEDTGREARRYFIGRKIKKSTIITYGLGYAPPGYENLLNFLKDKGYTADDAVEAGLAVKRDNRIYDKFRDRVMFPIIDLRGNIIGFGGRTMLKENTVNGHKIPKYLNTAETPVFDKGRNLFSLNLAKNAKESEIILCEGYMDVISVYQSGIKNIVATLGTAVTESQIKLLMRYAREMLLCYDSDEAGIKAALRAIDIINKAGGKSRVIRLKGAKDPDEYINKNGVSSFREALKKAVPSTEFKISLIKSKYDINTTEGKIQFISEAANALMGVRDAVEVDAYINKIAAETGIGAQAIYSEYRKRNSKGGYGKGTGIMREIAKNRYGTERADGEKAVSRKIKESEKRLLGLASSSKRLYNIISREMPWEEFSTEVYRRLAKKIYECRKNGNDPEEAMLLNEFSADNDALQEASEVFYNMEKYGEDEGTVSDLLRTIKLEKIQAKIDNETDLVKLNELIMQQKAIKEE